MFLRLLALPLFASSLVAVAAPANSPSLVATRVDPATVVDMDFERHRDRSTWRSLTVQQIVFRENGANWRLWRIASKAKPRGPLWVVPHDNENAAFAAGLVAVRRWGGVLMAVDSAGDDTGRDARYVRTDSGERVDPNRIFTAAFPQYVTAMLADLNGRARPIVALHTNSAGFDPSLATCGDPATDREGSGDISALLCNATYTPFPARKRVWPWDDDDSVVIAPYLAAVDPEAGWCVRQLKRGNFNLTLERVGDGDGSLSNYAAARGLAYLNFETRDLGSDPAAIAQARDRMVAMIAAAMKRCPKWKPGSRSRLEAERSRDRGIR